MTGFWDLVPCSDSDSVNLLDEWLGASHWRFQCFEFLVSKMRVVKVLGLPKWCSGKEYACQCRRCWRCRFNPWIRKIPWWRKWQPTPLFLLGKFYGQRSLAVYNPWGHKESNTTERVTHLWVSKVALVVWNLPANVGHARDTDLIPASGRSPGGGHGNRLQCSCLENSMDRGA